MSLVFGAPQALAGCPAPWTCQQVDLKPGGLIVSDWRFPQAPKVHDGALLYIDPQTGVQTPLITGAPFWGADVGTDGRIYFTDSAGFYSYDPV
ncbi:MAG: hypothetical protein ACR2N5_05795, partial [Solirubrobacterales bacterium]